MNEKSRLKALQEYKILDTLPEKEFEDIVDLATAIFKTPMAFISFIDSKRQWFKAKSGIQQVEAKREDTFCNYTIKHPEDIMVLNDTLKYNDFRNNPFVTGKPHIRFYAGAPLVTPKAMRWVLCV